MRRVPRSYFAHLALSFAPARASASASYKVEARVRSAWNTGAPESTRSMDFPIQSGITSLAVASDKAAPQGLGTTVTFTATPTGGQAPYQYRWAVWNGTAWTVSAWGTGNTYAWTPTSVNSGYKVEVRVRSAWDTGAPECILHEAGGQLSDFVGQPLRYTDQIRNAESGARLQFETKSGVKVVE